MSEMGLSQAELARRVGVKQPTIFGLIHQNKTGSVHLHKVARELGTTPAYLSGETDDPDSTLPDEPELSAEERAVVDCLRMIQPKDRAALVQLARSLAGVVASQTHAPEVLRGVEHNPTSGDVGYLVGMPLGNISEPTIPAVRPRKRPKRKLA